MLEDAIQKPKKRFKKRYMALMLLAGVVFTCKDFIFISTWNVQLTVNVETPKGIRSGSSVRRYEAKFIPDLLPETASVDYSVFGEAVAVELAHNEYAFVLLSGGDHLYNAFPRPKHASTHRQAVKYYRSLDVGTKGEVKKGYTIVRFSDLADPKSVELLYGYQFNINTQNSEFIDNFQMLLGEGFALQSFDLEITDKPVKYKIDKILPWLKNLNGGYLHGKQTSRDAPLGLQAGAFVRKKNNE